MPGFESQNLSSMLTDIQGFSNASSASSREEIVNLIRRHSQLMVPVIEFYKGTIVKSIGDAFLCTFKSATDAVVCSIIIQLLLREYNSRQKSGNLRMQLRIVINTGDVSIEGSDIFGDAVNITSRMEGLECFPGGAIGISESTFLLMNRNEINAEKIGSFDLKGIPYPVTVFSVPLDKQKLTALPGHLLDLVEQVVDFRAGSANPGQWNESIKGFLKQQNIGGDDSPKAPPVPPTPPAGVLPLIVPVTDPSAMVCPVCGRATDQARCPEHDLAAVSGKDMIPKCTRCGKEYMGGEKFCPEDRAPVIAPALQGNGACGQQNRNVFDPENLLDYRLPVRELFARGWNLFRSDMESAVLKAVVLLPVLLAMNLGIKGIALSVPLLFVLSAGIFADCLMRSRGQKTTFKDLFLGFDRFKTIFGAGFLSLLWIAGGLCFFLIPGLYFMSCYLFVPLLIVDKNMGAVEALKNSRRLLARHWMLVFRLIFLLGIINVFPLIGSFKPAFRLLFLLTLPYSLCVISAAYLHVVGCSLRDYRHQQQ
ncbi:MAG: adenylate/guanylate cyclase domain-containing protein [Candidatus Wallbacteria bacterium]|nr:adenylate/guanylate cyclase domain-containing protein [Candidatus Wallbacteria bacterium]